MSDTGRDVKRIKALLDEIEAREAARGSTNAETMVDFVLVHMRYVNSIATSVRNKPGRNKSYATAVEQMSRHLESVIKDIELWKRGVPPE